MMGNALATIAGIASNSMPGLLSAVRARARVAVMSANDVLRKAGKRPR